MIADATQWFVTGSLVTAALVLVVPMFFYRIAKAIELGRLTGKQYFIRQNKTRRTLNER